MSKNDDILRLLVAEESLNDAEMLISVLRNAGQAVRASQAEDAEDLQQALAEKTFDLFLCSTGMAELSLDEAVRQIKHSGKDLPLVAINDVDDGDVRREAMRLGAADLVSKQDLEHLSRVLQRELRNLRDRRRLRRLEASLRETEKRCSLLLESSRDAIAYVHEGMHLYANRAYLERFGVDSFEDIEGTPLLDMIAPDDQGSMKDFLRRYNKGDHSQDELELSIISDDVPSQVTLHFSPASIDGEPCTQVLIREQADSRALEAQLDTLSKQDLLSGLYNRSYFMEHLQRLISENAEGAEQSHGLLYIALDNLEQIQLTLGITAIDQLITDVAGLIRAEQADQGLAARFSDDAFTVVLEQAGVHETIALGEAIRHAVEALVTESGGRTVTSTCSIGVSMVADASNAQQALDAAHQAADTARVQGGNRVHLPTSSDEEEGGETGAGEQLRELVATAAEEDRFHLVFQPVASLQGESVERYEVRLRMQDREGKLVLPGQFIPQSESWGLLPQLDRWVMSEAVRVLQQRNAQGTELMIKLSGPTLEDDSFLTDVGQALKDAGVEGHRLIFQLNEPVAVTQLNQAKQAFRGIKELNCGFCLDHFGSGLNPFQLVKHLPADYLKLDATLTAEIGSNAETQQACKQVIDNAQQLHKKVIAGYLEDVNSMATLWQFGVDYVQGNFLQEPERGMHYDFSGMVI
ncbi:EAL domain-containing protein [Alkalilimnicola sp. S0819]|uniref:EAL domain-containing response regulator n=1 Tax=Alkalilimnicola sp. S0819 TaxID=2613922 RepID=UPI0012623C18|nr:EAL domain-containing protein [Alkalilimnicola sp. S0819]KAB7627831.1 EAL domain-containing protein [Alkalilimnicola sp. S0819]MPQ15463.1 EAL domain-containing protein [Alkalilimnicola sp. S0819]